MNIEIGRRWAPYATADRPGFVVLAPSKEALRLRLFCALMVLDCAAICTGFGIAGAYRFGTPLAAQTLNLLVVIVPVFLGISLNSRAYSIEVLRYPKLGLYRAVTALVMTTLAIVLAGFYLKVSVSFSRLAFGIGTVTGASLMIAIRLWFGLWARAMMDGNPLSEVVISDGVGCDAEPGMLLLDAAAIDIRPDIGDPMMLDRLGRYLKHADRVVVACPLERRRAWAMALKGANISGELVTPELDDLGAIGTGYFGPNTTMMVSCGPLDLRERIMKRLLDVSVATFGLALLSPLLLLVAALIKIESAGPIFFVQNRSGHGNRLFRMYKFRSMRTDLCDSHGAQSTRRDDDRITRIGRFIRRASIDELPQLFNVLRGDMSVVGPRPHALGSTAGSQLFWEVDHRYWHRHASKPGLTGLAQVRGFRGATESSADLTNRLQADLEYQAGWTIWRDISILFSTVRVMIHKNAF